jgi:outer membrane immunogenic protein
MKMLALHVAAISVLLAGAASAADLRQRVPVKSPAPVPVAVYTWTGCYVGAGGGYGMVNQDTQTFTDPAGAPFSGKVSQGGRGWFGTVQVGCDYQIGSNIVIGAFGDYDFGNISGDIIPPVIVIVGEERLRWSWAAGGRIGWVVVPQLLAYVSGGYTQAHFGRVNFNSLLPPNAPFDAHLPANTYSGWFIGTGYEYALGFLPGLYWKTEYRFADYSTDRLSIITTSTGAPFGFALETHKYVHTVRSELVWRFNFGGPVVARY